MIINLTGCKAIVTGSTAGIGRATAEGLARAGAAVVVNGRTNARVEDAVRQIRQTLSNADVTGVAADMATAGTVKLTALWFVSAEIGGVYVNAWPLPSELSGIIS